MSAPSTSDKAASKMSLRSSSKGELLEGSNANTTQEERMQASRSSIASKSTLVVPGERQGTTSTERLPFAAPNGETVATPSSAKPPEVNPIQAAKATYGADSFAPPNPDVEMPAEGIFPLFLTTMTQELFHVKSNEEVTAEKPIKIIPKADIVSDIQSRLAISDFHPAKSYILDYPGDEILLYFDASFKYGQNFVLCITPEAAQAVLKPLAIAAPEEILKPKRPQPKVWECFGSDKEIEAERITPTRDLIYLKISQRLKDFGAPCAFSDKEASELPLELRSFKDPAYEINRMELCSGVQAIPTLKDAGVQTNWFRPLNFSCQYEPRLLTSDAQQHIIRSDDMIDFVSSVTERYPDEATQFEKALQQNCIMNIFSDDFITLGEEDVALEQGSHTTLQEYQSFTDLKHSKDKSISCVDWHPTQKDPNIIAGGCVNGQILLWDISEYQDKLKSSKKPKTADGRSQKVSGGERGDRNVDASIPVVKSIASSSIEFSHRMLITDIQWLPRNLELSHHSGEIVENGDNGSRQLVTCSSDGQVFFWDTRSKKDLKSLDLLWKPFLRVPLSAMDNTFDYGLAKASIRPPILDRTLAERGLETDESLAKKIQQAFVKAFFEREVKRIAYVYERKQFRVKERGKWEQAILEAAAFFQAQKAAAAPGKDAKPEENAANPPAAGPAAPAPAGPTATNTQDEMDKAEQEYLKMERTFLEMEGLIEAA
ncbi:WD repeat-containing protein 63 [Phlyctochytrium bullatum]|nr:WD repeat-containing protein 63 [Phlyctochytrium bullatum]